MGMLLHGSDAFEIAAVPTQSPLLPSHTLTHTQTQLMQWEPDGYLHKIAGHACYDPIKDLVVPLMKTPDHYHMSPLIGGATHKRTWLAFHRGRVSLAAAGAAVVLVCRADFSRSTRMPDRMFACQPCATFQVQFDNPPYSRGIRQRLAKASNASDWLNKHKIVVGE